VKFPRRLRHNDRGKVLANLYKRRDGYRVGWRVTDTDGKRVGRVKDFVRYAEALRFGRGLVKDLAKGRMVLTPLQAKGAAAAFDLLQGFYGETGKRVPLLECVTAYCGALRRLGDQPLTEAIDAFLANSATVSRKGLSKAVEDWLAGRQPKTVAKPGKRPQLSSGYHYNTGLVLREFAAAFPNYVVCDLGKEHLDLYMAAHAGLSPKSRNERRGVIRMFLKWCVAKDYLSRTHRLLEADGMAREDADAAEIEPYTAEELQAMLDRASKVPSPVKEGEESEADYRPLLPIIALVALGGIRLEESTRLDWEDVWHIAGHIEVSVVKSKTRSRRLVTIGTALAAWLEDYRDSTGPLWAYGLAHLHKSFEKMLAELEIPVRRNALRHGFISAHYAAHSNEGLTARLAGNSPEVVHSNYISLMTKQQGEAWFNVTPARPGNVVMLSGAARQK
jgi:integrase